MQRQRQVGCCIVIAMPAFWRPVHCEKHLHRCDGGGRPLWERAASCTVGAKGSLQGLIHERGHHQNPHLFMQSWHNAMVTADTIVDEEGAHAWLFAWLCGAWRGG